MKYSANNKPLVCMQTTSRCYKGTTAGTPVGILWHSTGANNPWLKRYVQPSDNASDKAYWLNLLGKNQYNNDWNHTDRKAGMNCWIGKLADGAVTTVQTMPWNYRPWGCGSGSKGSCNGTSKGVFWIQFEICEDGLTDKNYFNAVYQEACEITAYLCDMFNIDPHATVKYKGVNVPTILCHADSHRLGLGNNHGDIYNWFRKHGKDMDDVRNDVATLMKTSGIISTPLNPSSSAPSTLVQSETKPTTSTLSTELKVGDEVRLVSGATYTSGKPVSSWVFNKILYIRELRDNKAVISTLKTGAITGVVALKYLIKNGQGTSTSINVSTSTSTSYKVKVTADVLNIRKGAGTNYDVIGKIKENGIYTIVEESTDGKWGLLESYASKRNGWIRLSYVKKI